MAKAAVGAMISDGGRGVFPADILCIGNVNVVIANPKLGGIQYGEHLHASHVIDELPLVVYQSKERGIFVVPAAQLLEVKR